MQYGPLIQKTPQLPLTPSPLRIYPPLTPIWYFFLSRCESCPFLRRGRENPVCANRDDAKNKLDEERFSDPHPQSSPTDTAKHGGGGGTHDHRPRRRCGGSAEALGGSRRRLGHWGSGLFRREVSAHVHRNSTAPHHQSNVARQASRPTDGPPPLPSQVVPYTMSIIVLRPR